MSLTSEDELQELYRALDELARQASPPVSAPGGGGAEAAKTGFCKVDSPFIRSAGGIPEQAQAGCEDESAIYPELDPEIVAKLLESEKIDRRWFRMMSVREGFLELLYRLDLCVGKEREGSQSPTARRAGKCASSGKGTGRSG